MLSRASQEDGAQVMSSESLLEYPALFGGPMSGRCGLMVLSSEVGRGGSVLDHSLVWGVLLQVLRAPECRAKAPKPYLGLIHGKPTYLLCWYFAHLVYGLF